MPLCKNFNTKKVVIQLESAAKNKRTTLSEGVGGDGGCFFGWA